jgi:hypothetical protein
VAAARAGGPTTARAVAAVRDVRVRLLADDQGLESRHSPASR